MATIVEKLLGQVQPDGSTTAVTLVAVQVNTTRILRNIFVCNTGGASQYSIYHGSASAGTALFLNADISASSTAQIICYVPVEADGSAVMVKAANASQITFTGYGADIIESPYNIT